jgi:hypothetical protein
VKDLALKARGLGVVPAERCGRWDPATVRETVRPTVRGSVSTGSVVPLGHAEILDTCHVPVQVEGTVMDVVHTPLDKVPEARSSNPVNDEGTKLPFVLGSTGVIRWMVAVGPTGGINDIPQNMSMSLLLDKPTEIFTFS